MRKLGIGTYTFAHHFLEGRLTNLQLVQIAVEHQLKCVQFCENSPLVDEAEIVALCEINEVQIQIGTRGIGNHLFDALDQCARVGSPFLRLVIDTKQDEPAVDEAIQRLQPYVQYGVSKGVTLAIENHDRFSANDLIRISELTGTRIVLDTANSIGSLEGPNETLKQLGPLTVNLHWKPIRATRIESQLGFEIFGCPTAECPLDFDYWLSHTADSSVIFEQWAPNVEAEMQWFLESISIIKLGIERHAHSSADSRSHLS
jgi:hypothetical protein